MRLACKAGIAKYLILLGTPTNVVRSPHVRTFTNVYIFGHGSVRCKGCARLRKAAETYLCRQNLPPMDDKRVVLQSVDPQSRRQRDRPPVPAAPQAACSSLRPSRCFGGLGSPRRACGLRCLEARRQRPGPELRSDKVRNASAKLHEQQTSQPWARTGRCLPVAGPLLPRGEAV